MSFIETERLMLRLWMPSDLPSVVRILGDAQTMRYIGSGYSRGLTEEEAAHVLERMTERYEKEGIGIWPVALKDGGTLVGMCGLQHLPENGDVEIAYIFDREQRGKGYATEAASAVLDFGFEQQKLSRIVAVVHPLNAPSIRLLHRVGMKFVSVKRVYRMDALEYEKRAAGGT